MAVSPNAPEFIQIDASCHLKSHPPDVQDPRGLIWMYEPPRSNATYVMGCDATVGITSWHRALRTEDDSKTDNGAIEIIRVGQDGSPDTQVAEFAAPCDPYELAAVANQMGRLYGGSDEDGQCLSIVEVYPGPGMDTMRRMIDHYGYTNQYVWKYRDNMTLRSTNALGWYASHKSNVSLWVLGTSHIVGGRVRILSEHLIEEFANCERDEVKQYGKALSGCHDDRVRAFLMALWACNDWANPIETISTRPIATDKPRPDWQACDMSYEEMMGEWNTVLGGFY
jgi:hypothetical protein